MDFPQSFCIKTTGGEVLDSAGPIRDQCSWSTHVEKHTVGIGERNH